MMMIFKTFSKLAALGAILIVLIGFLGWLHPAFDTFAQFRLHVSVSLFAAFVLLLVLKARLIAFTCAFIGAVGIYTSASGTAFTAHNDAGDSNLPIYTMLHFNLYWLNEDKPSVVNEIIRLDADIMTVVEQSGKWRKLFSTLHNQWPYQYLCFKSPRQNATSVYSKWPLIKATEFCGNYSSLARVDANAPNGKTVTLAGVHMRWPWPASGPRQLKALEPELQNFGENALVAGDFNATTWSWAVKKFAESGELNIVPGIGSTWMAALPGIGNWFWAGLPIDNVMEKGNISVLSAKTLGPMGSDHLPIWIEFQILN